MTASLLLVLACAPARDPATGLPFDTGPLPGGGGTDTAEGGGSGDLFRPLGAETGERVASLLRVRWQQLVAGATVVEYRWDGGEWMRSPEREREAGEQEELLLGIPFEAEVEWRPVLVLDGEDAVAGPTATAETGELDEDVPVPLLLVDEPDLRDPDVGWVLYSILGVGGALGDGRFWTAIVDRAGRVVWALETPRPGVTFQVRPARDEPGTLLVDRSTFWSLFDEGAASTIARVDIEGEDLEVWETPGLHHPFEQRPDGTLAWTAWGGDDETIVELDPESGERVEVWHCGPFREAVRGADYCGSNALAWVEETGRYLYSSYSMNTIVEVDRATGSEVRWFGNVDGSWDFDPAGSAFWWQHGARITAEGHLLVSTRVSPDGDETVVREYELDEKAEVLHQVWTFGEGEGIFAAQLGEAEVLPGTDHVMHNLGAARRLREVTRDGEVVWDLEWPEGGYLGRTTMISDLYELAGLR